MPKWVARDYVSFLFVNLIYVVLKDMDLYHSDPVSPKGAGLGSSDWLDPSIFLRPFSMTGLDGLKAQ